MRPIDMSEQQQAALAAIDDWYHDGGRQQVFLLEGPAGSGKSTLARHIGDLLGGVTVVYGAYTGKAASVMRAKGCDDADTIHSLIYIPHITHRCVAPQPCADPPCAGTSDALCQHVRETATDYVLNPKSVVADVDLVVIDEVSMVGAELGRNLLSFDTKILVLGDRNQLPPIDSGGYFTNRDPDFALTEIHRQAAGSPIIHLATQARLGVPLRARAYGDSAVIASHRVSLEALLQYDQVICGRHRTRNAINQRLRRSMGFDGDTPSPGEKVICLKNCKPKGLLNGTLWNVVTAAPGSDGFCAMLIRDDSGRMVDVTAPIAAFGMENGEGNTYPGHPFDFGYAITCHKSQGSQWDSVAVYDESFCWRRDNQHRNWLYTAVTRASERVLVVM
jgi:exodeoxyribonuclease-5